jgi:hypothetical protein
VGVSSCCPTVPQGPVPDDDERPANVHGVLSTKHKILVLVLVLAGAEVRASSCRKGKRGGCPLRVKRLV